MKKKPASTKIVLLIMLCAACLTGCASISYTGADFNAANVRSVQTDEGLYFSTYQKTSAKDNVDMSIGLTRTTVPEVLAVYVGINNKNNISYIFYQRDFIFSTSAGRLAVVSPSQYINAYQSQQTGAYAGMQALAPTISNIATIANNFQNDGQNTTIREQNAQNTLTQQIGNVSDGIMKYSLSMAGIVEPSSYKYFYIFIQSDGEDIINLSYKDLEYTFGKKTKE